MSTVFILLLGLIVIFWRPPFQTSNQIKKIFKPILLILIMILLLFVGAVKSFSSKQDKPPLNPNTEDTDELLSRPFVQ